MHAFAEAGMTCSDPSGDGAWIMEDADGTVRYVRGAAELVFAQVCGDETPVSVRPPLREGMPCETGVIAAGGKVYAVAPDPASALDAVLSRLLPQPSGPGTVEIEWSDVMPGRRPVS